MNSFTKPSKLAVEIVPIKDEVLTRINSLILNSSIGEWMVRNKHWPSLIQLDAVIIFGFGGIVDRQRHALPTEEIPKSVIVLSWILLGVSVILFIARLVIVSYKYRPHSPPVNTSHNKFRKHHGKVKEMSYLTNHIQLIPISFI